MKQLFIILFSALLFNNTYAQINKNDSLTTVNVYDSTSSPENKIPAYDSWTNDHEHILTAAQRRYLDSMIAAFEKETTVEIAIVTINRAMTTAENFDRFVLSIANTWGVGKKDLHNGIVIGLSAGLRKIRIENGSGIVGRLSNEKTTGIIDNIIIPACKKGEYFFGLKNGLAAIMNHFR